MIPELLVGYAKWGFDEKRITGGRRVGYQVLAASRRRLFERPPLAEGMELGSRILRVVQRTPAGYSERRYIDRSGFNRKADQHWGPASGWL